MNDTIPPWPQVPAELVENPSNVKIIPTCENQQHVLSQAKLPIVPDNTGLLQNPSRFQAGISGNPKGRPKGARNRFTETFMRALSDDFIANGAEALSSLRTSNPEAYLRIIISLLPKSLIMKYEESFDIDFDNITNEELAKVIEDAQRQKLLKAALESVCES